MNITSTILKQTVEHMRRFNEQQRPYHALRVLTAISPLSNAIKLQQFSETNQVAMEALDAFKIRKEKIDASVIDFVRYLPIWTAEPPVQESYNTMLHLARVSQDYVAAVTLLDVLRARNLTPSLEMYMTVLTICKTSKQYSICRSLLKEIRQHPNFPFMTPSAVKLLNSIELTVLAKDDSTRDSTWSRFEELCQTPSVKELSAMVLACKDSSQVWRWIKDMSNVYRQSCDATTYSNMIGAFSRLHDTDAINKALDMFDSSAQDSNGVVFVYDSAAQYLVECAAWESCGELVDRLFEKYSVYKERFWDEEKEHVDFHGWTGSLSTAGVCYLMIQRIQDVQKILNRHGKFDMIVGRRGSGNLYNAVKNSIGMLGDTLQSNRIALSQTHPIGRIRIIETSKLTY